MQKEIIERKDQLPATIEELVSFVIVGNEAVKAWKNKMRAVDKANIANEAHKQVLKEGQQMAELVLLAEGKLGELLLRVPPQEHGEDGKFEDKLPKGINRKESHYAKEIYRFPNIMHEVIAKAIDKNDVATRHAVISAINLHKKKITQQDTPPLPEGKYNVIYADPPWDVGSVELDKWDSPLIDKYPTMKLEEIKELKDDNDKKVEDLTNDDCSLFLWTTHTFLEKAFEVIKSWGFKYHCCITWDKGGGWSACGFHRRTEFCLYAYKGKINVNQEGDFIPTLIVEKKGKHSKKPKVMRDWIISNSPKPRIELFAREKIDDEFDVWGYEVNGKEK